MNYSIERKPHSVVEVKMTLTKEEVAPIKANILKELAKKVEVPGFRKGHAPADKIEANFPDAVKEELVEAILKANYENILTAEKINPVSYIYGLNVESNDNLTVTFSLDEFPVVTLGEYKGLTVEKRAAEVTDEAINHEIDAMVASKVSTVEAEEGYAAQLGDIVDLGFAGSIDGVPFDGGTADSHELKLGSRMFIDNFEEQLVGYVTGQEGEVNVNFPAEYGHAPLAGKPATFKVKINKIMKEVKPELTEELAKELKFDSIEDMRTKISAEIMDRELNAVKNETVAKLLSKINETSTIDLPGSMIAREVEQKLNEMEQHLSMQGANMDMYLKMINKTKEELKVEMTPMAINKVKADILLETIAKNEHLVVTEEEVNAKMVEIAAMYGMDAPKLHAELVKHNNLQAFLGNVNVDLTIEKAIDFLLANN